MGGPLRNWLKRRFIAGFFVTVPAVATGWLLWVFWSAIDDFFDPLTAALKKWREELRELGVLQVATGNTAS